MLILPAALALSDTEVAAIRKFVKSGGMVIADYLPGIMDEHCRSRGGVGALDDVFGVKHDWSKGLYDGKHTTCIDGEKYKQPLAKRLFDGIARVDKWPIVELGVQSVGAKTYYEKDARIDMVQEFGDGAAWLLNISVAARPMPYNIGAWNPEPRLAKVLLDLGMGDIHVSSDSAGPRLPYEVIRWRRSGRTYLCIVKNPANAMNGPEVEETGNALLTDKPEVLKIEVSGNRPDELINERTGKKIPIEGEQGHSWRFSDSWVPCEAAIYSYSEK